MGDREFGRHNGSGWAQLNPLCFSPMGEENSVAPLPAIAGQRFLAACWA